MFLVWSSVGDYVCNTLVLLQYSSPGKWAATKWTTRSRKGDWRCVVVEQVCWLQAVDGDPVEFIFYLQLEGFLSSLEYFVGSGVWRGERRFRRICPDEDVGGRHQVRRHVGRSCSVVSLAAWDELSHCIS